VILAFSAFASRGLGMKQLVYYVACSIDGFIARQDGSFNDFLQAGEHLEDLIQSFPETIPGQFREQLGIHADNQYFDTVLMGHKTYEVGAKVGMTNPYPHLKQYLFARRLTASPDANVELISTDAVAQVKQFKQMAGKNIWLCGGGTLAQELLVANLIDRLILKVNPIMIGAGIPLFSGEVKLPPLGLIDSKIYGNGVAVLHYQVIVSK
jgi:dihydrofolate reductase